MKRVEWVLLAALFVVIAFLIAWFDFMRHVRPW